MSAPRTLYLVAYDVPDDARRTRVALYLRGWGRRIQKSVFECSLCPENLQQLVGGLRRILRVPADRCHIYRLCGGCARVRLALGEDLEPPLPRAAVV